MKILCLILASDTLPEHIEFQKLWKRFINKHPDVHCYFYKGDPNLDEPFKLIGDTLWIKIEDTWETIYEKTLRAFDFFLPIADQYDFLYRTNVSTLVSYNHMIEYCRDLPKTECCAAVAGGVRYNENSVECEGSFPGGNGFLLSIDLMRRIAEERPENCGQDDSTIGVALQKWKIPIHQFVRPDLHESGSWFINNRKLLTQNKVSIDPNKILFTYRFKTKNRSMDLVYMSVMIYKLYGV